LSTKHDSKVDDPLTLLDILSTNIMFLEVCMPLFWPGPAHPHMGPDCCHSGKIKPGLRRPGRLKMDPAKPVFSLR